jgi:hypothetical protein
MKTGDLVRTTRARIGCPLGTLGLVIAEHPPRGVMANYTIWTVLMMGKNAGERRWTGDQLEVV